MSLRSIKELTGLKWIDADILAQSTPQEIHADLLYYRTADDAERAGKHHIAKLLRTAPRPANKFWVYQPLYVILGIIICTLLLTPGAPDSFYAEQVERITGVSDLKSIECPPRELYASLLEHATILDAVLHSKSPCLVQLYAMSPKTELPELEKALQHATHSPRMVRAILGRPIRPQFIWSAMTHASDARHTTSYSILMHMNLSFLICAALLATSCTLIVCVIQEIAQR